MIMRCCGGLHFLTVPFIGLLRADVALTVLALLAVLVIAGAATLSCLSSRRRCGGLALPAAAVALVGALGAARLGLLSETVETWRVGLERADFLQKDRAALQQGRRSLADTPRDWRAPHRIAGVFSAAECANLTRAVVAARDDFVHVDHLAGPLPFFTLGPYWGYLHHSRAHDHRSGGRRPRADGARTSSSSEYFEVAREVGARLLGEHAWAYARLLDALGAELARAAPGRDATAAPVELLGGGTAPPAFHVIYSHRAWTLPVFRVHSDETFRSIARSETVWPQLAGKECDDRSRVSFTAAIHLPRAGGSLNYLDLSACEGAADDADVAKCAAWSREEYAVGEVVLHAGTLVHQIGEWAYSSADDPRITLQGFGFRCGDTWYVYW